MREKCGTKHITQSRHTFAVNDPFLKYYAKERGRLERHIDHALELLGSTDIAPTIKARVEKTLGTRDFGRPWGWLGEIVVTYLVESEPDVFGQSYITHAAWRNQVGGVGAHVDLVGINVDDGVLLYAESKARTDSTSKVIDETAADLKGQLDRTRIETWRDTAYDENITAVILAVVQRGIAKPDPTMQHSWVKRDTYRRIAHVVTPNEPPWFPLLACVPTDATVTHPVHVMTTGSDVLAGVVKQVLEWELALQQAGLAS